MRCTEAGPIAALHAGGARPRPPALRGAVCTLAASAVLALLLGCAQLPPRPAGAQEAPQPAARNSPQQASQPPSPIAPAAVAPVPASPSGIITSRTPAGVPGATEAALPASTADRGPMPRNPRYVQLPPPPAPRSEDALRVQLAQRLVEAHPDGSYTTRPPARLLAIPVLEIDLNADGSVRNIKVLRKPSTGHDATVLAIAAVRRAAPYGDVSHLPKPWRVVEAFLFDDHLRFKPRTLDVD